MMGKRYDLAEVVRRAENFRLVRLPREHEYNQRNFAMERFDGQDAMGVDRWIANVEDDPDAVGWLINQLGILCDDAEQGE